jgi:hypothetical protein
MSGKVLIPIEILNVLPTLSVGTRFKDIALSYVGEKVQDTISDTISPFGLPLTMTCEGVTSIDWEEGKGSEYSGMVVGWCKSFMSYKIVSDTMENKPANYTLEFAEKKTTELATMIRSTYDLIRNSQKYLEISRKS